MSTPTEHDRTLRGFLTKPAILDRCRKDHLIERPEGQLVESTPGLKGWSYDMRLGTEVFLSSEDKVRTLGEFEAFFIQPGDFALLTTEEHLHIPLDLVAFITLRFHVALRGLINISGFHVDPGFNGRIVFSVYNAGPNPVALRRGDPIFMVVFTNLDGRAEDRTDVTFKDIEHLKAEWIAAAKGPTVNLVKLNRRVDRLQSYVNTIIAIGIAVVAGIIVAFVLGVRP